MTDARQGNKTNLIETLIEAKESLNSADTKKRYVLVGKKRQIEVWKSMFGEAVDYIEMEES